MFFRFCIIPLCSISLSLILGGCGASATQKAGKFYDNDGPPSGYTEDQISIGDVVPKIEKPVKAANRPYKVMGQQFYPMSGDKPFSQVGIASWYGKQFHGKKTAIGDRYDMFAMTAAHPTMELPSYAKVTNLSNGRSVIVRVNDRGPFIGGRAIDMSYAAAIKLGYQKKGTTRVKIERITRKQIASGFKPDIQEKTASSADSLLPLPKNVTDNARSDTTQETRSALKEASSLATLSSKKSDTDPIAEFTSIPYPTASAQATQNINLTQEAIEIQIPTKQEATATLPLENGINLDIAPDIGARQISSDLISIDLVHGTVTESIAKPTWSSQIGAFSSEKSASEEAAHAEMMLSRSGNAIPVRVIKDKNLYCVLVGDCDNQTAAKTLSKTITDTLGVKSFVIFK